MRKMREKIGVMAVVLLSIFMLAMPVLAADTGSEIMPASTQTNNCTLSISGVTATSSCFVSVSGSDSISVTLCLQKYKNGAWETVQTKTNSTTGTSLSFSMSKLITAGKFRAKAVATVKQGSSTETKTSYSATKTKS